MPTYGLGWLARTSIRKRKTMFTSATAASANANQADRIADKCFVVTNDEEVQDLPSACRHSFRKFPFLSYPIATRHGQYCRKYKSTLSAQTRTHMQLMSREMRSRTCLLATGSSLGPFFRFVIDCFRLTRSPWRLLDRTQVKRVLVLVSPRWTSYRRTTPSSSGTHRGRKSRRRSAKPRSPR